MAEPLKILIASDTYPPFIGGAHRQTQLLAQELARRGHTISVATPWHPGLPEEEHPTGVSVYRVRQLRTLWKRGTQAGTSIQQFQPPFPDPVTVLALRRLIRKEQPDLVHSYGWITYSCAVALMGTGIPLVASSRDYGYSCPTRTLLYRGQLCSGPGPVKCLACAAETYGRPKGVVAVLGVALFRPLLLRALRGVHSVSPFVQAVNQRDLVRGAKTPLDWSVIPSFLLPVAEGQAREEILAQLPDEPFILYVGELTARKGLGPLLEAYQKLRAERAGRFEAPPPPLVLVGYVTDDTPQTLLSTRNQPPGVVVLTDVPHPTVMAAWQRCLFGVVPSLWPDPSPGVVREAMSQGKAVIGTCLGGTTDMIQDNETGLLVPPGDVSALALAMERLTGDQQLRERMGRAARRQARAYLAEMSVPAFEGFYRRVLGQAGEGRG